MGSNANKGQAKSQYKKSKNRKYTKTKCTNNQMKVKENDHRKHNKW